MNEEPRVTLVTRVGCHLCEAARATVRKVAEESGCQWRELDVDTEPDLPASYSDRVPVVLVDGRVHDQWRVDEARLRAALSDRARQSGLSRLTRRLRGR